MCSVTSSLRIGQNCRAVYKKNMVVIETLSTMRARSLLSRPPSLERSERLGGLSIVIPVG